MALANYADLKAAVIKFSGRDDLSDTMDDFILLAEEMMFNNDGKPLRLRSMETTVQLSTVAGVKTLALPAEYLQARSATIEASGGEFDLVYYGASALPTVADSGIPRAFTVKDEIQFDRTPDAVYTINFSYYAKPTALSSGSPTNSILTDNPSIYLNGCLSGVYELSGEFDLSEAYFNRMTRSIMGAIKADKSGRRTPGAQGRVSGSRP